MDCFIKKIFDGNKEDKIAHMQFQKFSKGEFENRALIRVKNSKGNFTLASGAEYAKDLVISVAEKLGDEKVLVTGALIAALDLEGFEYKEKKMAMGARKYMIETEMSGNEIIELSEKVPKAFIGLSFKSEKYDLKIKPKSPKSMKGASSQKKEGKKLKIDFCKLKTSDEELIKRFVFDEEAKGFKNVEIAHDFFIDEIVMPSDEELGENKGNFAVIREMAKRKGKIVRRLNVDKEESSKEIEFLA